MRKHFIALLSIIALAFMSGCSQSKSSIPSNKKEIMDRFVAGTLDPSYAPAAFFVHFSADAKEGEAAVKSHLQYFVKTDMDILKVQFEQWVPRIRNYELQESWDAVEPLPEDYYRPTLEVIAGLQEIAGSNVYVLPTIYSAYQLATQSLGEKDSI